MNSNNDNTLITRYIYNIIYINIIQVKILICEDNRNNNEYKKIYTFNNKYLIKDYKYMYYLDYNFKFITNFYSNNNWYNSNYSYNYYNSGI